MATSIKIKAEEITILPAEIEKKVNTEISVIRVEANVTDDGINKLKEEYGSLTIADQSDKEGYLNVQAARKNVKKIRVAAEKLFDQGRQEAVEVANRWLDNKKRVVEALKDIETPLEKLEDAYEEEDKRIKAEKAAKAEQQGIRRTSELMSYGAALIEGSWVLGELAYESVLCKNCDEDIYQGIRDQFKAIFDANEKTNAEEAEKTRLATEKLLKDQEDLKRMQKEAKDMRTQGRISFLESLGMQKHHTRQAHVYADQEVSITDIEEKEAQDWEVIIAGVKEGVEAAKRLAKEAEKNREIFANRFLRLDGWSSNGQSVYVKGTTWGTTAQIIDMSDEEFEKLVAENDEYIKLLEDAKKKKADKAIEDARLDGIGKSRRQTLNSIQGHYDSTDTELGSMAEEEWNVFYGAVKFNWDATQKVLADKKEKERLEEIGEKGRYEELVKYLKAAPIGEYRSSQYRSKVSPIRTYINNL